MTENELKRCREEFETEFDDLSFARGAKAYDNWETQFAYQAYRKAWQHQSALLAKAVEALEGYVKAHNENNLSSMEMRIAQETLAEINKGDNDAK